MTVCNTLCGDDVIPTVIGRDWSLDRVAQWVLSTTKSGRSAGAQDE